MSRVGSVGLRIVLVTAAAWVIWHWPHAAKDPAMRNPLQAPTFGPKSTGQNNGWESANHISPIVPASYSAIFGPRFIGVQFLGDSAAHLKADQFRITVQGGPLPPTAQPPNTFSSGFVGYRFAKPLPAGTYHVTFSLPGFNMPPIRWTLTVRQNPKAPTPESSSSRTLLASLNTVRQTLGLKPVRWSEPLEEASQAHADYLARQGFDAPSFHKESPGRPGFTGVNAWNRDLAFGWPTPEAGEVGIEWSLPTENPTVMSDLIDTVYHRLSVLSPNLTAAGTGQAAQRHSAVVMDVGYGYDEGLPLAIVYPYEGQPGVPTSWVDIESPDPVGSGLGGRYGYPVTVDFPTADRLDVAKVRLSLHGRGVPVIVDSPGVGDAAPNQIGLVPEHVLKPNSRYTVTVRVQAIFNDGSRRPVTIRSHFWTGRQSQSLAATVESPARAVLSDVTAGSGVPLKGQRITVYRLGPGGRETEVARGVTDDDGLMEMAWPGGGAGWFEAVSQSNNAVMFRWRD